MTLTALFDCDAGFLVNDTVVFSADVLVLRESSEARSVRSPAPSAHASRRGSVQDTELDMPAREACLAERSRQCRLCDGSLLSSGPQAFRRQQEGAGKLVEENG